MPYGYEPPKHEHQGSWAEAFLITKIVFQVLAGPLAFLFGTLALLILTLMALFTNPALALIPLGIVALGIAYLVRRDRKMHEAALRDVERGGRPPARG
jgi:hypothetical protein